ncbi:MAG TPA: ABC transporter substrate-binding protein [Acetobacteraceae bacterium]
MIGRRGLMVSATASAALAAVRPVRAASGGGTLAVAIFADPLSFDPHLTGNLQGRAATRAIHDTLFTVGADGRIAPSLVERWDQPDPTTYMLHLRQGVRFQDGTPFDAAAVQYNLARIFDPKLGSIRAGELSALEKVEVVDDHTLRLTLKYPFSAFLFPLTDVAGCIGSPAAMQQWKVEYGLHPSGTGPFKLAEYQKDAHTSLDRNGDYWMPGRPLLDHVLLRPIPIDTTRMAELQAGGVQIAEALPLQNIRQLRQAKGIVVSERVGFRWEYFGFDLRPAYPGRSKPFRQAFQWAIDREALHQVAYFGTGAIGYDGILPSSPFFDKDYKPFTYDPDRAKRLIEQSGLGSPIVLKGPLQPDPVKQRAAQVFQANAAAIGVQVQIEQVDSAGYNSQLSGGTMAVDLQGWWGYRPDPDQYLAILLGTNGSYAKYNGYSDPEMDKLIMAERAAASEAERRPIFRKMSALMNDDAAYVPWHYTSDFKGLSPRVKGFIHPADGIIDFRNISLAAA